MHGNQGTNQETQPTPLTLETPAQRLQVAGVEQFVLPTPAADPPAAPGEDTQAGPAQPSVTTPAAGTPPAKTEADSSTQGGELNPEQFQRLQQKARKLEKANATLAKENEEFKRKQAEAEARRKAEEREVALEGYNAEQHKNALKAVADLDPDDPEYAEKSSRIWAGKDSAVRRKARELEDEARIAEAALNPPPATPDQDGLDQDQSDATTATQQATDQQATDPVVVAAREKVNQALAAADLDPADPVFQHYATLAPVTGADGTPLSFDDQVTWAVDQTVKYQATLRSRTLQETDQFLPRGATPPAAPAAPATPGSLDSALRSAQERRRIA